MKKASTVLFVIVIGAGLALMQSRSESQGAAASFKVDAAHSSVIFRIKHLGIGNVYGRFNELSGTLNYASAGAGSAIDLTIRAASVDTNSPKRDNHLRSPDFFSVKEFPTITFKSTNWKKTGDNAYEVTGNLSLHGKTKTITAKCLNVLDFDFDADDHRLKRRIVRAMNITVDDPAKSGRHASGMESLARRLMKFRD